MYLLLGLLGRKTRPNLQGAFRILATKGSRTAPTTNKQSCYTPRLDRGHPGKTGSREQVAGRRNLEDEKAIMKLFQKTMRLQQG
jgi:hypothetical protein